MSNQLPSPLQPLRQGPRAGSIVALASGRRVFFASATALVQVAMNDTGAKITNMPTQHAAGSRWRRALQLQGLAWQVEPWRMMIGPATGAALIIAPYLIAVQVVRQTGAMVAIGFDPRIELLAGALMWIAPALIGGLLRLHPGGRQRLRLHGAEHIAVDGALITPMCGSVWYSRAVLLLSVGAVLMTSALALSVGQPQYDAALPAALGLRTVALAACIGIVWKRRDGYAPLDRSTIWLQRCLVMKPEAAELAGCSAALERLRNGADVCR